jgi:hypothetical protein
MRNLKQLIEWFPMIALITHLGDAPRGVPRVQAAIQVLQFLAGKTEIRQDDEVLRLLQDVLLTDQGRRLVDYVADEIRKLSEPVNVTV